jgi:hypothetical protein
MSRSTYGSFLRRWDPFVDAKVADYVDPHIMASGLIASYTGPKGVWSMTQPTTGKKPTRSATSCNGKPGLDFAGGQSLIDVGLKTYLAARTGAGFVFPIFDSTTSLYWGFANDGSGGVDALNFIPNDSGGAGNFEGLVAAAGWKSAVGALSSPAIISIGFDKTIDRGVSYIRINGVSQTLTNRGGAVTPGGSGWTFNHFYLGALDASGTAGLTGTYGTFVATAGLLADGSDALKYIENGLASRYGL